MWRRTAARSHPTARPTNTPPVPTTTNRPAAPMSENAPVTAAATATRYATIAAASLIMLSPSRIVTTRRGISSRRRNAVAAATSGGETTAPSANADAHASKVTPTRSARTVSKLCMAFATVKVTFRRASLNLPLRSRRHAHRLHRAHPPLVPAHDALASRAGAVGRRLDAGAGHAAVGTVPAVHRRRRRDRGHGGDVPRLQPRPPR